MLRQLAACGATAVGGVAFGVREQPEQMQCVGLLRLLCQHLLIHGARAPNARAQPRARSRAPARAIHVS